MIYAFAGFPWRRNYAAALEKTREYAVKFARGRVKDCITVSLIYRANGDEISGRVFNDISMADWSSYLEFGTGAYVNDEGVSDAIRLKRAKSIPWYIHVSMVSEDFGKYGYSLVIGADGEKYWQVMGSHPHPYMKPAAFQSRSQSVEYIRKSIADMLSGVCA